MADIGLAVAQTLLAAMDLVGVKEKFEFWGYKSELPKLEKTIKTVKNVLKDFQAKELNEQGRGYIQDLKDAVYDADDLFDELNTVIELKELEGLQSKHTQIFKKVRRFFSSDGNQLSRAYRMYNKVKEIKTKLNLIADDRKNFVLGVDDKPIIMRREETCSYIQVTDIIGRDDEKKNIMDELLRSKNEDDVRFFTIAGVGGMGKTALAQLVYSDEHLKQQFGNSMYWVCVSDQDRQQFDVKAILCKILQLAAGKKSDEASSLEVIQKEFQENVRGKKCLLVLDDLWNEDREKWVVLEKMLQLGQGGSRVLITTRSKQTATIIGDGHHYMLQGLSPENSRRLFEMAAFGEGQHPQQQEFKELGDKIVGKCCNNPLAIKVVGSLLYRQDIHKWKSFEKSGLARIQDSAGNIDNKIMSVLKFSYHNLENPLKCCFSYCAVFPKDYVLKRRVLISLWMAQGYIVPSDGGQSTEDAAEEYFSILLRRCFFQDVKRNNYGDVKSVKIHDLMHDVAQEVGGEEVQVLSSVASNVGKKTRHVSVSDGKCIESSSNWTNLRSIIRLNGNLGSIISLKETQVGNWRSVRVLNLMYVDGGSSLNSIGRLHHLRYLNLSGCPCEELPSSITKLHNLETLILSDCRKLKQLPHGFNKLVRLSELDVHGCWQLNCMPLGMDKLTRLRVLPYFVVGEKEIAEKQCDEIKVLGTLTNLTGSILIDVGENYKNAEVKEEEMSGGYLSKTPGLKVVGIDIRVESVVEAEGVMEKLQPHPNVARFTLWVYKGRTIPRWGRAEDNWAISLPNLVNIKIHNCEKLINLPSFSKLAHLKKLVLYKLGNLEYMEKTNSSSLSSSQEATVDTTFFPSLVSLQISNCGKLKGWFSEDGDDNVLRLRTTFRFPCLSKLQIRACRNLTSFPRCPFVKDALFWGVNETGQLMKQMMGIQQGTCTSSSSSTWSSSSSSSSCLATLIIRTDSQTESLSEYENIFEMCGSSLRKLEISDCNHLTRISTGLQHLTALESLELGSNDILDFSENDSESMMVQWKALHQSLRRLEFRFLPKMRMLPKGMQYLTSLTTLVLDFCLKLEGLPEWISCLSSLHTLEISHCSGVESVTQRIQNLTSLNKLVIQVYNGYRLFEKIHEKLDGEDLTSLQHIPNLHYHTG